MLLGGGIERSLRCLVSEFSCKRSMVLMIARWTARSVLG